jgi:hypothetical protein
MAGWMTLTEAAAAIHRPYGVTLRLVLIGELVGARQDGKWRVSEASVATLIRTRSGAGHPGSPAEHRGEGGTSGPKSGSRAATFIGKGHPRNGHEVGSIRGEDPHAR